MVFVTSLLLSSCLPQLSGLLFVLFLRKRKSRHSSDKTSSYLNTKTAPCQHEPEFSIKICCQHSKTKEAKFKQQQRLGCGLAWTTLSGVKVTSFATTIHPNLRHSVALKHATLRPPYQRRAGAVKWIQTKGPLFFWSGQSLFTNSSFKLKHFTWRKEKKGLLAVIQLG